MNSDEEQKIVHKVLDILTQREPQDLENQKWYWGNLSKQATQTNESLPTLYEIGLFFARKWNLL